jgi:hypothetical protein
MQTRLGQPLTPIESARPLAREQSGPAARPCQCRRRLLQADVRLHPARRERLAWKMRLNSYYMFISLILLFFWFCCSICAEDWEICHKRINNTVKSSISTTTKNKRKKKYTNTEWNPYQNDWTRSRFLIFGNLLYHNLSDKKRGIPSEVSKCSTCWASGSRANENILTTLTKKENAKNRETLLQSESFVALTRSKPILSHAHIICAYKQQIHTRIFTLTHTQQGHHTNLDLSLVCSRQHIVAQAQPERGLYLAHGCYG